MKTPIKFIGACLFSSPLLLLLYLGWECRGVDMAGSLTLWYAVGIVVCLIMACKAWSEVFIK
jgi:hypothetical protein